MATFLGLLLAAVLRSARAAEQVHLALGNMNHVTDEDGALVVTRVGPSQPQYTVSTHVTVLRESHPRHLAPGRERNTGAYLQGGDDGGAAVLLSCVRAPFLPTPREAFSNCRAASFCESASDCPSARFIEAFIPSPSNRIVSMRASRKAIASSATSSRGACSLPVLRKDFTLDPAGRITPEQALSDPWLMSPTHAT